MTNKYEAENLETYSSGRAYRAKIGMYLSADRQEAINLGLRELIVNAQDEYEVYKPKDATVTIVLDTEKKIITVQDNLRGIPVGVRQKDGVNSLEAAFLIPHSGAKHEEGAYSSSVGVNGQGNKIVCHTAEWLNVTVRRDNKEYTLGFKSNDEGAQIVEPLMERSLDELSGPKTGTSIQYRPDPKVYGSDVFIDIPSLKSMLREMSYFTQGLTIYLMIDNQLEETFISKNGLIDGLAHPNAISKPFSYTYNTDDCQVELALQWVAGKGNVKGYANGLHMPDGGAFMTGFKTMLTRRFKDLSKGKYDGDSIRSLLDGYVSVKVKVGQFTNQQKTALANTEAREPTSRAISECLNEFYNNNRREFDKVVEILDKVTKAEAAAEKARNKILGATKELASLSKKKVFSSDKLKDAEKLGEHATLILTEGDSAAGSMILTRDPDIYGVLPLKGKVISALTNPLEDVLENDEVKLILSALGITPNRYNSQKLRYGKVIILSDGDADGANITNLVTTLFYVLCPELIQEGRLYKMFAPLYEIKNGKKVSYYYSEEEYQKANKTGTIERWKGIGSLSPESAKNVFFNKDNQRIEQLEWDEDCGHTIETLLGKDVEPRREFVFNNIDFEKYGEVI